MNVLDTIGRTRLIPLRHMVPEGSARILVKLESRLTLVASPTGGTTKALTLEMIETARRLASAPGSC